MNNRYSDEIIMDLLPLYVDGMVSEETGQIIRERLEEDPAVNEAYLQMSAEIRIGERPQVKDKKLKRRKVSPLFIILMAYVFLMYLIWALIALDYFFFYR